MNHQEEKEKRESDQQTIQEIIDNYRTVKKLGSWAVGIVIFVGAFFYAILQLKGFLNK